MRNAIVMAVMLLLAGIVSAQGQVCDPIAMGKTANATGSGNGPDYNFQINGNWYSMDSFQSVHITVPATVNFGHVYTGGFLNLFGSYHSGLTCTNVPWNAILYFQPKLFDLTTNTWVNHCCMQVVQYLNDQTGDNHVVFDDYGPAGTPGVTTLTRGHVYEWEMFTSAYVYGLGSTEQYNGSVILTIE